MGENPLETAKRLEDLGLKHAACSGTVIGISETITIILKEFSAGKGIVEIVGTGIEALDCKDRPMTKSGQEVTVDVGRCIIDTTFNYIKYCSDSDTILLEVQHKLVPIPVDATLARID